MDGRWDVVIVGGGPAGLSAGAYLSRAGWRVLLLEKDSLGGQARFIQRIENYPGFPAGISGRILMDRFILQGRRWGLKAVRQAVTEVARAGGLFRVDAGAGTCLARSVIACEGSRFKPLGLPGEAKLLGRGIHHCAFGLTARFSGQIVAIAGSGDAAVHQALLLAAEARKVRLIVRGERLKAVKILRERLAACPKVEILFRTIVKGVRCAPDRRNDFIEAVEVERLDTGKKSAIEARGLFILVGKEPGPALGRWRSPPAGFFSAGDCRGGFRQVAVAAGDGLRAAMESERFLMAS
ncbi:MAG: FAD-dependent oxidoreductase [Elusimicrobia bacterium]|nr:FAD-dependent oxidoreductase [Elusimicrobiota bacterium]